MLRIIDANLNRIGEGLRVLEDITRFILNDAELTQQLKNMRHDLLTSVWPLQQQLLQARDSTGDIGARMEVPGEDKEKELPVLVVANTRRVQEALRVMEELSKNPDVPFESEKFKQARFNLYTVEKELFARLRGRE